MSRSSSSPPVPPYGPERDRLLDLLADQAMHDLSAEEQADLERLRSLDPALTDVQFDRAAAAAHVAFLENAAQALPEDLRRKLHDRGATVAKTLAKRRGGGQTLSIADAIASADRRAQRARPAAWIGWLAAAACLTLALWGWWPRLAPMFILTRQVDAAPDRIAIAWKPGADANAANSSGTVVWSNTLQKGYVRVRGLKVNDPRIEQYQLWIGDKNQKQPIDGGVFNIRDAAGDVIIPINAKLPVTDPTLFAVTVEKPGGVVVSLLERKAMLTPVSG